MQSTKSLGTEKRLAALEQAVGSGLPAVRILRFVAARNGTPFERDPVAFTTSEGLRWDRMPGESLEDFRTRATREVSGSRPDIAVLREEYARDSAKASVNACPLRGLPLDPAVWQGTV